MPMEAEICFHASEISPILTISNFFCKWIQSIKNRKVRNFRSPSSETVTIPLLFALKITTIIRFIYIYMIGKFIIFFIEVEAHQMQSWKTYQHISGHQIYWLVFQWQDNWQTPKCFNKEIFWYRYPSPLPLKKKASTSYYFLCRLLVFHPNWGAFYYLLLKTAPFTEKLFVWSMNLNVWITLCYHRLKLYPATKQWHLLKWQKMRICL